MKENPKISKDNNQHLFGYINDVRIGETQSGKTMVNLDVATVNHGEKKPRSYHKVTITDATPEQIEKYKAIQAEFETAAKKNEKAPAHTISLDGPLVNRERNFKESEKTYQSLAVLAKAENVDLDVKRGKQLNAQGKEIQEPMNRADLMVNIVSINVLENDKLAVVRAANNFRTKDSEEHTFVDMLVSGKSLYSKNAYDAIVKGEYKVGDAVDVHGQVHDSTRTVTIDGKETKKYGNYLQLNGMSKHEFKKAQTETKAQETKAAEAPKQEVKAEVKPKKKATSKKTAGPKL